MNIFNCENILRDPPYDLQDVYEKFLKLHRENILCTICRKKFPIFNPHCADENCSSDPHHTAIKYQSHRMCSMCGKCHKISIITDLNTATSLPLQLIDLITDYILIDNRSELSFYCSICNICTSTKHCKYTNCDDPHHQHKQTKDNILCDQCKECHSKTYKYCANCNHCFDHRVHKYCIALERKLDPDRIFQEDICDPYCFNRSNFVCQQKVTQQSDERYLKEITHCQDGSLKRVHSYWCLAPHNKYCKQCGKYHIPISHEQYSLK